MAFLCAAAVLAGCSPGHRSATTTTTPSSSPTVTSIPDRTATTAAPPGPDLASVAWKATVHGAVYAQPVVVGSRVFVVTEQDEVDALSLATGRLLWHASIGTPLTDVAQHAGCGDIDPLGITSTPVATPANDTLYVVGEISTGADPPIVHRRLVGFDTATGKVVRTASADPTGGGDNQIALQQRAGLVLDTGRVDVAFGGLYGDCGYYHGWVVAVSITPGVANLEFNATAGGSGGAIWQGGAPPSVDAAGNLYLVTGNQNSQGTAGYYESAVKLSPALVPEASFRDTAATDDQDFGTGSPLLLPDGTLFVVGKTDVGYVLEQADLHQIASIPSVCGSDPDGRIAFDATTLAAYVPCRGGGIQEVDLATDSLGWKAGKVNSSPILAGGSLWALSYPDGALQALNPATGAVEQSTDIGQTAPFATPAYADGSLIVANAAGAVEAFRD
jgi:outer membrane protein assembly factor BamB